MPEEEYKITGSFAGNSINGFAGYVKDGSLDWESAKKDWALNDNQRPMLTAELEAAGYLGEKAQPVEAKPKKPKAEG